MPLCSYTGSNLPPLSTGPVVGLLVSKRTGRIVAGLPFAERSGISLQGCDTLTDNLAYPAEVPLHAEAPLGCSASPPTPRFSPHPGTLTPSPKASPATSPSPVVIFGVRAARTPGVLQLLEEGLRPLFCLLKPCLSRGRWSVSLSEPLELLGEVARALLRFRVTFSQVWCPLRGLRSLL